MTALPPDVVADLKRENARLQAELRAARDRQTGSAEILRAIASASGDAERSLQQIAETTARLFGAPSVTLRIADGDGWARTIRFGDSSKRIGSEVSTEQLRIGARNLPGTVVRENRQIHIPDLDNVDPAIADWPGLPPARAAGTRVMAGTPLRRESKAIGVLIVYRDRPVPFTDEELALQQSFADQAVIAIENARLFNETKQALARQTATSDVLRVISQSPTEVQPVFDAIVLTAVRLLHCDMSFVMFCDSTAFWVAAAARSEGLFNDLTRIRVPIDPSANFPSRAIVEKKVLHLPDWSLIDLPEHERNIHETVGINSALYLPLLREGECIGLLTLGGKQANIFGESEIALAESFRDQALIAIENTRLFNETQEALERQTATAEILKVIASSPSDVQPVFDVIVERAVQLCGARMGRVYRYDGNLIQLVGEHGLSVPAHDSAHRPFPRPASDDTLVGRVMLSRRPNILADLNEDETVPPLSRQMIGAMGARSQVTMPMLLAGEPIGAITLSWAEPRGYTEQQITLLQTFSDQAVIAIENVRLFNETREALERQTATAEILKVIASSPSDVQPVFQAIATSANRLLGGFSTAVFRFVDGIAHLAAFTPTTPAADEVLQAGFPSPLAGFEPFKLAQGGQPVQIADIETLPDSQIKQIARARGFRSMLFSPLMSDGTSIGLISVTRLEPGAFAAHHVQLLQTFADQAVIAIENVRLFDEVQAKTRDLTEALTYQTGSGKILSVIASSPTEVVPVLNAIVESACELCEAYDAVVLLKDDDHLRFSAHHGPIGINIEKWPISRNWTAGRAFLDRKPVHVRDMLSAEGAEFPDSQELSRHTGTAGIRTILAVPLLSENESIGTILLRRTEVHSFSDKQIALLQTFADQAVIAIGNVRLFDEVQAKTRDLTEALTYQTGSGNILRVIASSPTDVKPVLEAIVRSACDLCEADDALVTLKDGDHLVFQAHHGAIPVVWDRQPINRHWTAGRAVVDRRTVHVADLLADEGAEFPGAREFARQTNVRTVLTVPLLSEGESIGAIVLRRTEVRPFSDKQITLLQTFADQAVIAIGNVRLFEQVQQRTRELAASLDDLRAAQDRLVQTEKLASLGQLTAGIAHEIKNPLNFVNNFAALSAELTDELNEVLKPSALDDKTREEVDDLTRLLKENLEKVVQHGKRADSIVKNMLLHSREGSGDHRPADINALLDESLNLAYHGARAEKPQFNVTLQRDFDEMAGMLELFPQEITRVFLNLISNGFYAVTKRKAENDNSGFEPVLRATTRNLGDTVEIRIRDNGTGIPPEVKDKMFNPFFTTKPAGEGTGLGLSMSHDIIVKQHGGSIDVATEPGQFTEFTIILPRTSNLNDKKRGQT